MVLPERVTLIEVGPRDGFQSEEKLIPTGLKVELIEALADSGLTFPGGVRTKMPRLPIEVGSHDFGIRRDPAAIGADTRDALRGAGYTGPEIDALLAKGVVAEPGRG